MDQHAMGSHCCPELPAVDAHAGDRTATCFVNTHSSACPHAGDGGGRGGGRGEAIAGIANANIAFTTVESEREGLMHMQQLLDALPARAKVGRLPLLVCAFASYGRAH